MELKAGLIFVDPQTGFTWKMSTPWINRWRKRQMGWICQRAAFHPLQDPVSYWREDDITKVLTKVRLAENNTLTQDKHLTPAGTQEMGKIGSIPM